MTVSLALIGTGKWGEILKKNIEFLPGVVLSYQSGRQWRELIHNDDIDGVIIATPPSTHAQIALAWIAKGIPVFIEKPISLSSLDSNKIVALSNKYGVAVQVGYVNLYNSAFHKAKEIAINVGDLRYLVGEGSNNGPYRTDYSVLWDWASHQVSMMLCLMKTMPIQLSAWATSSIRPGTKLWDSTHLSLTFPSGTIGYVYCSCLHPVKQNRLTIIGKKSSIVYDDVLTENKVTLYEHMGPHVSQSSVIDKVPLISHPPYETETPVMRELEAFLDTIKNKTPPLSDATLGLQVTLILEKAEESILKNGLPIFL
jgi:UDP-2-acetamido-3-amino-2,3-dideoxy-glucuronate N-acetyltransferase